MQCYKWFIHFKVGRTSTNEDPRPGQPSVSKDSDHIKADHAVICEDCNHFTVQEVAEEVGISRGS